MISNTRFLSFFLKGRDILDNGVQLCKVGKGGYRKRSVNWWPSHLDTLPHYGFFITNFSFASFWCCARDKTFRVPWFLHKNSRYFNDSISSINIAVWCYDMLMGCLHRLLVWPFKESEVHWAQQLLSIWERKEPAEPLIYIKSKIRASDLLTINELCIKVHFTIWIIQMLPVYL